MKCKPWHGDIDLDTLTPIRNGKPYMVGLRTCNNSDCVRKEHVITANDLEAERNCLFYLTGVKRTYKELLLQLKGEA